jgi:hypothetical protein
VDGGSLMVVAGAQPYAFRAWPSPVLAEVPSHSCRPQNVPDDNNLSNGYVRLRCSLVSIEKEQRDLFAHICVSKNTELHFLIWCAIQPLDETKLKTCLDMSTV